MFSLIVTLISIALVAALALATLYYGGPVFNQGAARAHAAKIAAQGQQLQGAAELYKADTGEYPISLAELVAQNYLKSVPVAAAQEQVLINNALAASAWVMVAGKIPVFALTGVSEATCKAVNLGAYGVEGILKTARSTNRVQCFGTDVNNLMIVQAKAPTDLVAASTHPAAVIAIGTVTAAPVPTADSTDTSDAGWLVAPGSAAVAPPPVLPAASLAFVDNFDAVITTASFADIAVGKSTLEWKWLTVKNTGTSPVTVDAKGALVPSPYLKDYDTCAGTSLAPNATCNVSVGFAPAAAQVYSGSAYQLTLSLTGATSPSLSLAGTGIPRSAAPSFKLTADEVPVGVVIYGMTHSVDYDYEVVQSAEYLPAASTEGESKVVTITNDGDYLLTLEEFSDYGTSGFIQETTCGPTLAVGSSCQVTLVSRHLGSASEFLFSYTDSNGVPVKGHLTIGRSYSCWPISC